MMILSYIRLSFHHSHCELRLNSKTKKSQITSQICSDVHEIPEPIFLQYLSKQVPLENFDE